MLHYHEMIAFDHRRELLAEAERDRLATAARRASRPLAAARRRRVVELAGWVAAATAGLAALVVPAHRA